MGFIAAIRYIGPIIPPYLQRLATRNGKFHQDGTKTEILDCVVTNKQVLMANPFFPFMLCLYFIESVISPKLLQTPCQNEYT